MRPYLPDLITREAYAIERDQSELRSGMWRLISDLNPYNPKHAPHVEVPVTFSIQPEAFFQEAERAKETAQGLVLYLRGAQQAMHELQPRRDREYTPRWRANFDLMQAQLYAYEARIYEYGAYLEAFQKSPKIIKNIYGLDKKTNYWDIAHRAEILVPDKTREPSEKATKLFKALIAEHPGTPWAARAEWELARGYGVELVEAFYDPRRNSVKLPNL